MNFLSFLQEHLSHALPVLIAGAFGLAIILERVRALYMAYPLHESKAFFEKIQELVLAGRINEAQAACDNAGAKPVPQVVKAGLSRAHLPAEAIEQGLQLKVSEWTHIVQKRTGFLATIANVATLLGLFGTIAGLIFSFEAVGHADPQQKSALLSSGIATAMNATMLGLGVAIPCMIAFALLTNRTNRMLGEMEEAATRTLDVLKLRYYAADLDQHTQGDSKHHRPSLNGHATHEVTTQTKAESITAQMKRAA